MATAQQRKAMGAYGEAMAARHLTGQGMVLLERNWRCRSGEIDLVLVDGDQLVICEVKTRATVAYGSPLEAVTTAKLRRLRRLGAQWMREREVHAALVRIDVVGVLLDRPMHQRVVHLKGVAE